MSAKKEKPYEWSEVAHLLDQAFAVPEPQRCDWLEQSCRGKPELRAELESLLAADSAAQALFGDCGSLGNEDGPELNVSLVGSRIGPYELLKPIGQGGMGQVFLARRATGDFEQRVAVKLLSLQLDENARRRFHSECEHLARLDHPHIVGLLAAGTTQAGVSYLVLQLVEGQTLDRWSTESGATLRQRMRLFSQLCDAVNHAHQNLVIHRDIKPSNVLVPADPDGRAHAKLLDFGISRHLDDDQTATSSLLTPRFAAPEQLQGQPITTQTDVYGLGVVLHVLLTGLAPYADDNLSLTALAERSRRREPTAPSCLHENEFTPVPRRRLRGDLDAMVLKCLQTDPEDRYESALALRDDVKAWLEGRELKARRPSVLRRLMRGAQRNRWQTAGAGMALLVAAGAASYHWRTLNAERDEAVATRDFLVDLVSDTDPYRRSTDDALVMPLSEFYVAGLGALENSSMSPQGQAMLAIAFSQGLRSIDATQEALEAAEKAIGWTNPTEIEAFLRSKQQQALALTGLRRFDEAKAVFQELLSHIGTAVPENSVWAASLLLQYADCLLNAGEVAESLNLTDRAWAQLPRDKSSEEVRSHALSALMQQAAARSRLGLHAAARESSDQHIELARAWHGEDHIEYVRALGQAVTVRQDGSQNAFAEQAFRAAERVLGSNHSETLTMHNNYALRLAWQDRNEEAVEQFKSLIAIRQQAGLAVGDPHQNMAASLRSLNRLDEAWQQTELARDVYAKNLGDKHWRLAMPLLTQADIALAQQRPALAFERAAEAARLLDPTLGKDHYAARVARVIAMAARENLKLCTPPDLLLSGSDLSETEDALQTQGRANFLAYLARSSQAYPCR
ncbi:MAG: serine/threonine-protein kinase [Pseudomonadota bacterium]